MLKRVFLAIVLALTASQAMAKVPVTKLALARELKFNYRPILRDLKQRDDAVSVARETDLAVSAIVWLGARELRRQGYNEQADNVEAQHALFAHYLQDNVARGAMGDIGDHDPYSVWLSVLSEVFLYYLGPQLCEFLHLDDLVIINFGLVVVFNPEVAFDETDYLQHFSPFFGVVAFWSIWIGCEIGTASTGWFLICTPAGMAGEYVTKEWIAPPIGRKVYERWQDNHSFVEPQEFLTNGVEQ